MNSAIVLALFAVVAVASANPGLLGAPIAPVAYAGAPFGYAAPAIVGGPVLRAAPVAYAAPAFAAPLAAPIAPVAYGKAFLG